ncbi:MAG: sulfate permease [Saprospiraceae bacterium]|nr:sulfate permease [Saprospiraceae bacterium]
MKRIPLVAVLRDKGFKILRADALAALTVTVMLIPQGMAYALLAGLPPIYGLYAALVPMLIYPFFGSSSYLSVGPVALVSIIVLSGLSVHAEPMSQEYIELAILTSLVAGVIQIALAVLRMGFMVNFLSHPVISGFTSAAAVIIAISQLKHLLGIEVRRASNIFVGLQDLLGNLGDFNIYSTIIGACALIIILVIRRIKKAFPAALVAVVLGIVLMSITGWADEGVNIVGQVPKGLPKLFIPEITWDKIVLVTPLALVICLISFIESLAIAKSLAAKKGRFDIVADNELWGLGLAKTAGAFFQAFPNTGSFTRSAINEQAGAKSGWSSIFAAILIGLTLLFFTQFFFYLPYAVLAAIVIAAVISLIDYKEAIHLFKVDKRDFSVLMLTFFLTIFLGIQEGVLAGVILSLIFIIQKASRPHFAVLGQVSGKGIYRNIRRYREAGEHNSLLIFRYDDDLFFANAEHFYNSVMQEIYKRDDLRVVILDFSSVSNMDSTGVMYLKRLQDYISQKGMKLYITGPKGPLRDFLRKNKMYEYIGQDFFEEKIDHAVDKVKDKQTT